ncbi:hypothetical protein C0Q70_18892 [Pomacea canaliculata]|uniref:Uncharacterized protein n=1 Tax=Pomacea canaliculata TaxID=400727 RepID=A0A2T7NHS9_POMCA|nr:hypothetical protein C0Q70_18892 [Pomacea canaliculata]
MVAAKCFFLSIQAYPSLNLRIDVDQNHHQAHINLPGLRFDDIDHTGQPSMWRLLNTFGSTEHAAYYDPNSFLSYNKLQKQGIKTFSQSVTMEVAQSFYEVTTPKSPVQVKLNCTGIADSTFTTNICVMFGGRLKPSIIIKSLNSLIHKESGLSEQVPQWWRTHFSMFLPTFPEKPQIPNPPENIQKTFTHHLTVPLSDTDTSGFTRHPMYVRYFFDNMSIASNRGFYKKFLGHLHQYQVKRLSMTSHGATRWGDALTVETCEDPEEEGLKIHCFTGKNGHVKWYACAEFFPATDT